MGSGTSKSATTTPKGSNSVTPSPTPPSLSPAIRRKFDCPSETASETNSSTPNPLRGDSDDEPPEAFKVERTKSQYSVQFKPESLGEEEKELVEAASSASFVKRHRAKNGQQAPDRRERRLTIDQSDLERVGMPLGAPSEEPDSGEYNRKMVTASTSQRQRRKVVKFDVALGAEQPPPEETAQELSPANRSPFRHERVGMYSKRGAKSDEDGNPTVKINQDRGCACSRHHNGVNVAMFCVFDGHGPHGEHVSEFVMARVQETLLSHVDVVANTEGAIVDSLLHVDRELLAEEDVQSLKSGTTAAVVILSKNQLWVGNVGDSRTVLGSQNRYGAIVATDLSADHKPDCGDEFDRITAAGGLVSEASHHDGPARVWFPPNKETGRSSGPGLAMSRSVGDHAARPLGVIADPDVTHHRLCKADKMLIVASDGVWEVLSSQEAVDLAAEYNDATEACRKLVREAVTRWTEAEGTDYRDDITAIVVFM